MVKHRGHTTSKVRRRSGVVRVRTRLWSLLGLAILISTLGAARALVPPANEVLPVTLYVDMRDGSDSADGTSPDRALQTLDYALRNVGRASQIKVRGFAGGAHASTWSSCVMLRGRADRPLTIRPYDIEQLEVLRPVLSGGETINQGWTREPRRPQLWSAPLPEDVPDVPSIVYRNGASPLLRQPDRASLLDTPGSFLVQDKRMTVHVGGNWEPETQVRRAEDLDVVVPSRGGPCLAAGSHHVRIEGLRILHYRAGLRTQKNVRDVTVVDTDASYNAGFGFDLKASDSQMAGISGSVNGLGLVRLSDAARDNLLLRMTGVDNFGPVLTVADGSSTGNVMKSVLVQLPNLRVLQAAIGTFPPVIAQVSGAAGARVELVTLEAPGLDAPTL